ncbi:E3 SUMO-protein ligase CBX4 isoform X2 [Puntigrus tetrazona]|uniref:E3 SUMO-protein ligase CBX4 isoform X2 n=1 Tax=Puntigrus tetrazona TaxID=1606681 RepID=UPI001C8934DE|nr:E3 SUMO-protein ligase CBX4 isoform X2 [Puntigrus tetrazona]
MLFKGCNGITLQDAETTASRFQHITGNKNKSVSFLAVKRVITIAGAVHKHTTALYSALGTVLAPPSSRADVTRPPRLRARTISCSSASTRELLRRPPLNVETNTRARGGVRGTRLISGHSAGRRGVVEPVVLRRAAEAAWIYLPSGSTSSRWRASRRSACGRERQEQMVGYRKRGPKPKHSLVQLPAFARRSSILGGLEDTLLDEENQPKVEPLQIHRSRPQHYQLNSKKHHQYQPSCKEISVEQHSSGKKKHFYQLNSKKHHHYQPDPKMYDTPLTGPKEVKVQDPSNKSWNLPSALQQKWIRNKDTGCLSKVKDLSIEFKSLPDNADKAERALKTSAKEFALPNGISSKMKIIKNKNKNGRIVIVMSKYMDKGVHSSKVKNKDVSQVSNTDNLSEGEASGGGFIENTSAFSNKHSIEKAELPEHTPTETEQIVIDLCDQPNSEKAAPADINSGLGHRKRNLSEADEDVRNCKRIFSSRSISAPNTVLSSPQREPMNLHYTGSLAGRACSYDFSDTIPEEPIDLSCGPTKALKPFPAAEKVSGSSAQVEKTTSHVRPFVGNVIITDITTNCLTVTFKEYVQG